METKVGKKLWIMTDPDNNIYLGSIETSRAECWRKFCYPALKRSEYEKAGWKPKQYQLTEIQVKQK